MRIGYGGSLHTLSYRRIPSVADSSRNTTSSRHFRNPARLYLDQLRQFRAWRSLYVYFCLDFRFLFRVDA